MEKKDIKLSESIENLNKLLSTQGYEFLCEIKPLNNEEVEVTNVAMTSYKYNYSYLQNDEWEIKTERCQVGSNVKGCCLSKKNSKSIDIAGDILTGLSPFFCVKKIVTDSMDEVYEIYRLNYLYRYLYHTIGNCIPFPEGGNIGGRNCDTFTHKLDVCKNCFELQEDSKKKILDLINGKMENNESLGKCGKNAISYWIITEWKDKTWKDFVKENYLYDMVDVQFNPILFRDGHGNYDIKGLTVEDLDFQMIVATYIRNLKLIIQRGYRVQEKIQEAFDKYHEDKLKDIFNKLSLGEELIRV